MLTKILCPKCNAEGSFSLTDPLYEGPYRCWKCKELLKIRIERNVLKYCEVTDPEEVAKFEEIQALKNKYRRGGGGQVE